LREAKKVIVDLNECATRLLHVVSLTS
jgi:hypothetical protein